ncbi:alanine racemase [Paenibacillus protaetiae]|uniref:Alanine racemase n=1 Tax=Paenibacillus protaetiae TaxID=2509456 RepID=A0A4V0YFP8_9BACL|nr:alanine racemase [Paenibacillus protaetiae]QAY68461.1 alanine racemase [Paenibacillus protaetiae]
MERHYRPTRAEISLDALRHNLSAFRAALPEGMFILASVKANAYGHGSVEIAKEAEAFGIDYFGVAFLDEALQLRNAGVRKPILVLGFVPAEGLLLAREHNITIALYRNDILDAIAALPPDAEGKRLKAHIKIDSGMGRLGLLGVEEASVFIERAMQVPGLEVEGLFTHYARADEADKSYTELQYRRFSEVADYVKRHQLPIPLIHAANSAAGMETPEFAYSMVRLGIAMYGLYPSAEVGRETIQLEPVMSLKTEVVHVKDAPEGWGISYGTRYFTQGTERIGTLPVGYADGYSRMLTGKAQVLIRGVKAPVLGAICMDQCMVALDKAGGDDPVRNGEEVVLIGRQGDSVITADDIADQLGTINYEVTCMISARVPRVYRKNGQIVAVDNPIVRQQ